MRFSSHDFPTLMLREVFDVFDEDAHVDASEK